MLKNPTAVLDNYMFDFRVTYFKCYYIISLYENCNNNIE